MDDDRAWPGQESRYDEPHPFPGAGRGEAQDVLRTVVTQIVGDALAEHDPVRAEQPAELRQSPALPQRRCGVTRYAPRFAGPGDAVANLTVLRPSSVRTMLLERPAGQAEEPRRLGRAQKAWRQSFGVPLASGGWLKATMEEQPGAGDNGWPRFGPPCDPSPSSAIDVDDERSATNRDIRRASVATPSAPIGSCDHEGRASSRRGR